MTKEEAREILEEVKTMDDSMYQYNKAYLDALDMAIEALKQESILDKIISEIEQITDTMGVSYNQYVSKIDVLQIIDKHKGESEGK